jgi:2-dehydro-3-deoxy-D-arabinonate dehydratase
MNYLLQFKKNNTFGLGLLKNNLVYDISEYWPSLKEFLDYAVKNKKEIPQILFEIKLDKINGIPYKKIYNKLLPPIFSDKIYGLGITYKVSELNRVQRSSDGAHGNAVKSGRLVSFYKGDHHNCVGPTGILNVRKDSELTTPEPELAAIISNKGKILGYTIFNDVTAYDIEMASSLFTPEAKEYIGCCSMGPIFIPKEYLGNMPKLKVNLKIWRDNKIILERGSRTDLIRKEPQKLIDELCQYRYIPNGTVVTLGSSVIVPDEYALQEDDEVIVEIEKIGVLKNKIRRMQ